MHEYCISYVYLKKKNLNSRDYIQEGISEISHLKKIQTCKQNNWTYSVPLDVF
jgi:hypothetical protein